MFSEDTLGPSSSLASYPAMAPQYSGHRGQITTAYKSLSRLCLSICLDTETLLLGLVLSRIPSLSLGPSHWLTLPVVEAPGTVSFSHPSSVSDPRGPFSQRPPRPRSGGHPDLGI